MGSSLSPLNGVILPQGPGLQGDVHNEELVLELNCDHGRAREGWGIVRVQDLPRHMAPRVIDHCSRERHDRSSNSETRVLEVLGHRIRDGLSPSPPESAPTGV